jgi:hypothetical protein
MSVTSILSSVTQRISTILCFLSDHVDLGLEIQFGKTSNTSTKISFLYRDDSILRSFSVKRPWFFRSSIDSYSFFNLSIRVLITILGTDTQRILLMRLSDTFDNHFKISLYLEYFKHLLLCNHFTSYDITFKTRSKNKETKRFIF